MHMFTIKEAAEQLRMSTPWIRQKIHRGEIKYLRIGRRVFIPDSTIEEILKKAVVEPRIRGNVSLK
jgi:excisionase family DNA binding protein